MNSTGKVVCPACKICIYGCWCWNSIPADLSYISSLILPHKNYLTIWLLKLQYHVRSILAKSSTHWAGTRRGWCPPGWSLQRSAGCWTWARWWRRPRSGQTPALTAPIWSASGGGRTWEERSESLQTLAGRSVRRGLWGNPYQSARIPNTRYPKLDPTSRANLAMWTSHADLHTRLHCKDKSAGMSLTQGFNGKKNKKKKHFHKFYSFKTICRPECLIF